MSYYTGQQLRGLFDSLASQYEMLVENRTKLESDCAKLREYIDAQVTQIEQLNSELEKLRDDFLLKQQELGNAGFNGETQAPEQAAEESEWQDCNVETLIPPDQIEHPLHITPLAEIVDVSVVCSTAFSPDGSCLAIGSDKTLRVYDINNNDFVFQPNLDDGEEASNHIRSIVWTRDSHTLICGGEDGKIRVFALQPEQKLVHEIEVGNGEVFQIAISTNNEFFAATSGDGTLTLFNTSDFSEICALAMESEEKIVATSLAISPDDKMIAVGYSDSNVALWDADTHTLLFVTNCHDNGVYAVKFIPKKTPEDKLRLVTASLDNTVKIWDFETGADGQMSLSMWKKLDRHTSFVLSLALDPQNEWLLSGSKDLTAKLSSVSKGTMVYNVKGHTNSIITVAFSPNGDMFCTGSGDNSVKIWSVTPEETE